MGALSSLVQSGKLGIITSDSLRNRLAAWPTIVDDIGEDEIVSRDFSLGTLTAYLAVHGPLRDIRSAQPQGDTTLQNLGASRFPGDIDKLRSNPVFENLLSQKFWLTKGVIREYDYYRPVVDEILMLIEDEIDKQEP